MLTALVFAEQNDTSEPEHLPTSSTHRWVKTCEAPQRNCMICVPLPFCMLTSGKACWHAEGMWGMTWSTSIVLPHTFLSYISCAGGGSLPYASGMYISVWIHSGRMQTIVWLGRVPCVYYLNRLSVLVRLVLIALFLDLWSESLQYMDTTNVLLLLWRCIKASKVKGNSEKNSVSH